MTMATKRIRFVTDSTCDIPAEIIDRYQIAVVPTYVNIGEASYADDGKQLDRTDYYNRLPTLTPFPTTAAPSPGVAKQFIEAAFSEADHVIILTAPARLSAIYESMRLGAADLPPDRVTLIDSQTVTMAMGYQVQIGAEVAAETGDVERVVAAITKARASIMMNALIDSLDNLRRSGRINLAAAGIGSLLQIKPIITIDDGEVVVLSRVRTSKRAREELVMRIRQQAPLERLSLLHANNLEGLAWMREQVADVAPEMVYEININPTLGTHVGPHCLGFVTLKQNWRL
jgi:DegV family protein with EDD domain